VSSLSHLPRRPRAQSALTILALLAVALAAGVLGPASPARAVPVNRYVATTGTDLANDCTNVLIPCLTIQHAISQAVDGDTIIVAAGTYLQSSDIVINKGLTLQGANVGIPGTGVRGAETVIDFANSRELLLVASNVTIDGFKFIDGDEEAIDIDQDGVSNIIIRNNIFDNFDYEAVYYNQSTAISQVSIINNLITDVGQDDFCAIAMGDIENAVISGNYIDTTADCGIDISGGSNVTIVENIIRNVPESGIAIYNSEDVLVARNTIVDGVEGAAVLLEDVGDGIEVRNNFLAPDNHEDVVIDGYSPGVTIVITENAFGTSGTGLSIASGTGLLSVDATCNWWNSADGPTGAGAQAVIDPDSVVDYTPWLTSGTDTDAGTAGFQPGPCISDATPPVIQFFPEKLLRDGRWVPYGGEWHSGIVRVRVVCVDPGPDASGIVFDYTPARFWFEQDGTWTVAAGAVAGWRCRDAAGNIAADGPSAPIVARVDRRAPNCTVTPSPTSFKRTLAWQTVNVTLNPGAAPSGVDAIWLHSISGNASDRSGWVIGTEDYSGQLRGGGIRRSYTLTYAVRDNAGNVGYCSAIVKVN
jgi:parallel beta-helix repeat protein